VGNNASGLLRPDKIIIYIHDFDALQEQPRNSQASLGCPAQGVPFTARSTTMTGWSSWGIDPLAERAALAWQERESWRLWVTTVLRPRFGGQGAQTAGLQRGDMRWSASAWICRHPDVDAPGVIRQLATTEG